jgi:hypothetical protein
MLSLVVMQLPEKYKENFDVSSEGPSSRVTSSNSRRRAFARNVEILLVFFRSVHHYQRKLVNIIGTTYTGTDSCLYAWSKLTIIDARFIYIAKFATKFSLSAYSNYNFGCDYCFFHGPFTTACGNDYACDLFAIITTFLLAAWCQV